MLTGAEAPQFRRHLEKILDSPEFEGARQLRQFLRYVSEAALEGRQELEQSEIAAAVLHRGDEFNPVDSSSVRKLATLCRHRLEKYYAGTGVGDSVVVSLPLRSYVPKFRVREVAAGTPGRIDDVSNGVYETLVEPPGPVENQRSPGRNRALAVGLGIAGIALLIWLIPKQEPDGRIVMWTQPGGIANTPIDLSGSSVLLGEPIGPVADLCVQMTFRPERTTQTAGLVIYDHPRHYVKFCRRFNVRSEWELAWGADQVQIAPPQFVYDPGGQTGAPVWLLLRRERDLFRAFVSPDRWSWRQIGEPMKVPEPLKQARLGVHGHNGRSDAPSADAVFEHLSTGLSFHGWPEGPVDPAQFPGWRNEATCGAPAPVAFAGDALELNFDALPRGCDWNFLAPAPKGNWTLSTRLDFVPIVGESAGLSVRGNKGVFRVVRWNANGGSIVVEHVSRKQVNVKDFPGRPPVTLRLQARGGVLSASFSRDDRHFERLPAEIPLSELGGDWQVGLHALRPTWGAAAPGTARFHYLFQEVAGLSQPKPPAGRP